MKQPPNTRRSAACGANGSARDGSARERASYPRARFMSRGLGAALWIN